MRQEVPIVLPDNDDVGKSIEGLTRVFSKRDLELEEVARAKLSVRFAQLNEAIQSSVRDPKRLVSHHADITQFIEILDIAQDPSTHAR